METVTVTEKMQKLIVDYVNATADEGEKNDFKVEEIQSIEFGYPYIVVKFKNCPVRRGILPEFLSTFRKKQEGRRIEIILGL